MRRLISARVAGLILSALTMAGPARAGGPPVDVYLVAGQSNATGQGRIANLPSGFAADPRVWIYHSEFLKSGAAPNTWVPLRAASESVDKFGPELTFGGRMQQLTNNRPVALIKHALTYTNLSEAWNPGKDAQDQAHWGPMFRVFVQTVESGMKAMRDRGFEPTIRGMIWQQGESDADFQAPAKSYAANLRHLIERVRAQFGCPEMVFVYGYVLGPPSPPLPFRDTVRTAQGAIDQDSGSVWATPKAFVVFTDDLPHRADDPNTTDPLDQIHLGSAGVLELGRRMAETMAKKGKTGL